MENVTRKVLESMNGDSRDQIIDLDADDYSQTTMAPYPDFTQIAGVRSTFVVMYLLVMVLAVVGNALVCSTVFCNSKMHTAVNYYIVNLAACDFMVGVFVLPVKLLELTAPAAWGILNDGLCTALMYLQTIFVFASVLTLVAVCIERYIAILHPLKSRMQQTKRRAKKILFVTWLVPCVVASPFLYPAQAVHNTLSSHHGTIIRLTCFINLPESFRKGYYTFLFVMVYLLPLTFIAWTSSKVARCLLQDIPVQRQGSIRRQESNRRKVAKMVLVVILAFVLSWTPYFLVSIVTQYQTVNFMHKENYFFTMLCINLFAFVNSCVNPLIYCAMSTKFRQGFRNFFSSCFCMCLCAGQQPRADSRTSPQLLTKRGRVLGHFPCQVPLMCRVTQSSSESASGCHSDAVQQFSDPTRRTTLLFGASTKLKCKAILQHVNQSGPRASAERSESFSVLSRLAVSECSARDEPRRTRSNSASENDVSTFDSRESLAARATFHSSLMCIDLLKRRNNRTLLSDFISSFVDSKNLPQTCL